MSQSKIGNITIFSYPAAIAMALSMLLSSCSWTANRTSARGVIHPARWPQAHSVGLVDADTERFIGDLMSQMSVEEKVGQMIQADILYIKPNDLRRYPLGSVLAGGDSPPLSGNDRGPVTDWLDTTHQFHAVALEAHAGHTPIPLLFGIDSVHGNNNVKGATLFPHNVALGATRDTALVRRIAEAVAQETAAVGVDWVFAPTLAVPRDKRWGRSYEGYAENPQLVRQYATQMVLGLQGKPGVGRLVQNAHVAATAKHFVGDGATADGMDQGDASVSEAELIKVHAAGYPAAIDAGVMALMVSYSSWQGQKMHANKRLLTDVVKGRFGFEGIIVSDWNGHSQVPGCSKRSCAAAYNAGIDMIMAPDSWQGLFDNTVMQVRAGVIPLSRVDDAVRRILRVKAKLGLFDRDRPWDGKVEVLASNEHRALAREAVRESLVLLKNNDHVLPIKGNAQVLITGSSANDIGRQSGGWTLTWQGTGNKNSDFPNAESIYAGLRDAITAAGGSVELSADASFKRKPDVAVVVFGEDPTAEMRGDLRSLDYQVEHPNDLELLRKLQAHGVPVVAVFLSGRPLWVNPLLNASDAFVAAWFPGSEGGGIADLLIGTAQGKPRYEFTGRLPMSWPKRAAQTELNVGQKNYDPLFAYGYGLSYRSQHRLARLDEQSGVDNSVHGSIDKYFVRGRTPPPWHFVLRQNDQTIIVPDGIEPLDVGGVINIRSIDAGGIQEGGKQLTWSGNGAAAVALSGTPVDLVRQATEDMSLSIEYRVDEMPTAPVSLTLGCGGDCADADAGMLKLDPILTAAPSGEWRKLRIPLSCFRDQGVDLLRVAEPLAIATAGQLQLSIGAVRLERGAADAACLQSMKEKPNDQ